MTDFSNLSFVIDSDGLINLAVLDDVVWSMYHENGEKQMQAVKILELIRTHPEAWRNADTILKSQFNETKYFGLQLLEIVIKEKWRSLSEQERNGLKEFVMRICGLQGVDKVALQMLKRDWSMIKQLVNMSLQDELVCINCMKILSQLTPDVVNSQRGAPLLDLCRFILENAKSSTLLLSTLNTLKKLLSFLDPPIGLLQGIAECASTSQLRNSVLACLAEGFSHVPDFIGIFPIASRILKSLQVDLSQSSENLQSVILFITSFLTTYYGNLRNSAPDLIQVGVDKLVQISMTTDKSLFVQTVEFWRQYVSLLYSNPSDVRQEVLHELRCMMISRMAKPEEVIVVQLEDGSVVRETMKDTEEANLYKIMREVLIYLAHLDTADTLSIMVERLESMVDTNTTCWAIGSISGALIEEDENKFIVIVIRNLLSMCEKAHSKDEKAAVAANIMYVVAQYQRFLRNHVKFLKTVVHKLFEFMHELHDGVQDMACETFYKLVQRCRSKFLEPLMSTTCCLAIEIITNLEVMVSDLSIQQLLCVYEALASAVKGYDGGLNYIGTLMHLPNLDWNNVKNDYSNPHQMIKIIRINTCVCKQAGNTYKRQMDLIFDDLVEIYKFLSTTQDRLAYTIRTDILKLISTYLDTCESQGNMSVGVITSIIGLVLPDIDPPMVILMTSFVNHLKESAKPYIYDIFGLVFTSTLKLISQDYVNMPELRVEMVNFLNCCLRNCLHGVVEFNDNNLGMVMQTILWFTQHPMQQVALTGLDCLRLLFGGRFRMINPPKFVEFVRTYFMSTIDHIIKLIVEPIHTSGGVKPYALLLADMMTVIEELKDRINPTCDNIPYVYIRLTEILEKRHPNSALVKVFVEGLFSFDRDVKKLKKHLKDFIVQIRDEVGDDIIDLYLEEKAEEMSKARQEKTLANSKVPGLLDNDDTFDNTLW